MHGMQLMTVQNSDKMWRVCWYARPVVLNIISMIRSLRNFKYIYV